METVHHSKTSSQAATGLRPLYSGSKHSTALGCDHKQLQAWGRVRRLGKQPARRLQAKHEQFSTHFAAGVGQHSGMAKGKLKHRIAAFFGRGPAAASSEALDKPTSPSPSQLSASTSRCACFCIIINMALCTCKEICMDHPVLAYPS